MKSKEIRIVFMGTPKISATVLEALILKGYNIIGVIAQEDKVVGRNKKIAFVPTKEIAIKYALPIFQPHRIKNDFAFLNKLKPDLILTLAYGQIISQEIIDIPPLGCLNLHGSLLPKYRGASPIQYALFNNEIETGITLMEMIKEMDAGKIYAQKVIPINENDNATSLYDKLALTATQVVETYLEDYVNGLLLGKEQDPSKVTFTKLIKPSDEHLLLSYSCNEFIGHVRGLSYEPGGFLFLNDEPFKIYRAKYVSSSNIGQIGEIVLANKQGLHLQLKDGIISLLEVQKAGKKKMDYKSFINGNQNILHSILK